MRGRGLGKNGGNKKMFLDGGRQGWLVVVYKISIFGMGFVNKMVWYYDQTLCSPDCSKRNIRPRPGLLNTQGYSTPRATQSQPWPYPTQATRTLLSVNPCTVVLLNDSSRYRPEGEPLCWNICVPNFAPVIQVSKIWRCLGFAWHERVDQI